MSDGDPLELEICDEFMEQWPPERRAPIVKDCQDWDIINEVMPNWLTLSEMARGCPDCEGFSIGLLRCLTEAVYCMGYERGKRQRAMPQFIVAEGE